MDKNLESFLNSVEKTLTNKGISEYCIVTFIVENNPIHFNIIPFTENMNKETFLKTVESTIEIFKTTAELLHPLTYKNGKGLSTNSEFKIIK